MADEHQFPYRRTLFKNVVAEIFATTLFVFIGCGTAVFAGPAIGSLGIALGFAFTLFFTAIIFTGLNRVQFNPGLTLAIYISRFPLKAYAEENSQYWYFDPRTRLTLGWSLWKIVGQLLGALFGSTLLFILITTNINHIDAAKLGLAQNGWGVGFQSEFDFRGALMVEIIGSVAFFYIVVRSLKNFLQPLLVAAIGAIALLSLHLFLYPVTGASLNFARSFGPELVSFAVRFGRLEDGLGTDIAIVALCNSLLELGLFLIASIVSGVIAGGLARNMFPETDRTKK